jgi:hypothetical protein
VSLAPVADGGASFFGKRLRLRLTSVERHPGGTFVIGGLPVAAAREHDERVGDQLVHIAAKRAHVDLCWICVGEQRRRVVQRVGST